MESEHRGHRYGDGIDEYDEDDVEIDDLDHMQLASQTNLASEINRFVLRVNYHPYSKLL